MKRILLNSSREFIKTGDKWTHKQSEPLEIYYKGHPTTRLVFNCYQKNKPIKLTGYELVLPPHPIFKKVFVGWVERGDLAYLKDWEKLRMSSEKIFASLKQSYPECKPKEGFVFISKEWQKKVEDAILKGVDIISYKRYVMSKKENIGKLKMNDKQRKKLLKAFFDAIKSKDAQEAFDEALAKILMYNTYVGKHKQNLKKFNFLMIQEPYLTFLKKSKLYDRYLEYFNGLKDLSGIVENHEKKVKNEGSRKNSEDNLKEEWS